MRRALLLFALACTFDCVAADTLSIRADEWAPINLDPGMAQRGVMIDIAATILEQHGHTLDYRILSWSEAISSARSGKTDCVVGANAGEADQEKLIHPREPWAVGHVSLYARPDRNISITDVAQLEQYKLGVIDGYGYTPAINAYVTAHQGEPSRLMLIPNSAKAIRELLTRAAVGQIDVLVDLDLVMESAIREARLENRLKRVGQLEQVPHFIACTADSPRIAEFIELFDSELPKLRSDGRLAEILARYGLKDWQ